MNWFNFKKILNKAEKQETHGDQVAGSKTVVNNFPANQLIEKESKEIREEIKKLNEYIFVDEFISDNSIDWVKLVDFVSKRKNS